MNSKSSQIIREDLEAGGRENRKNWINVKNNGIHKWLFDTVFLRTIYHNILCFCHNGILRKPIKLNYYGLTNKVELNVITKPTSWLVNTNYKKEAEFRPDHT